jgi:hypothetical protein
MNAAGYYAVASNKTGMLAMLHAFFATPNHRHLSREHLLRDPDFTAYHGDADFQAVLDRFLPE